MAPDESPTGSPDIPRPVTLAEIPILQAVGETEGVPVKIVGCGGRGRFDGFMVYEPCKNRLIVKVGFGMFWYPIHDLACMSRTPQGDLTLSHVNGHGLPLMGESPDFKI